MTKLDLVNEISKASEIDKFTTMRIVETFMETIIESLIKDKNIYMRGFGSFEVKRRAEKKARNITKKTTVIIPAHFAPIFKPSKKFVELVKKNIHSQK